MNLPLPAFSHKHIIILASLTFFLGIGLLFTWKLYGDQIRQTLQSVIPLQQTTFQDLAKEEPEAVQALNQGNFDVAINLHQFILLDIRSIEDYRQGHIRGAISNPATQVAATVFSPDMKVALYSTDQQQLNQAIEALQSQKVATIKIIDQPLTELIKQGYTIDQQSAPPAADPNDRPSQN